VAVRALQIHEWGGALEEVDLPRAPLRSQDIRLRVEACGVGLTVVKDVDGELAGEGWGSLPRVPGHEICGVVIELGADVTGVALGDRGVAYFYLTCGSCRFCRQQKESLCEDFRGFIGVDQDGGYAEETVIPARNFVQLPAEIDSIAATAIPDAIATPVHVCRARARLRPGELVAVIGAGGGVGVHLVQVSKAFGADAIGIDISREKLDLASEVGAQATFIAGSNPDTVVREIGRPADVVVDTVGTKDTIRWGLEALGKGGRFVVLVTVPGAPVCAPMEQIVLDEIAIVGSRYASYSDVEYAIRLVVEGRVQPIVSERLPLAGAPQLHDRLRSNAVLGRAAVVPSWSE
jgi:propanol-preferring alcohol dehydrogenase